MKKTILTLVVALSLVGYAYGQSARAKFQGKKTQTEEAKPAPAPAPESATATAGFEFAPKTVELRSNADSLSYVIGAYLATTIDEQIVTQFQDMEQYGFSKEVAAAALKDVLPIEQGKGMTEEEFKALLEKYLTRIILEQMGR